jgi:hypothetical protein
MQELINNLRALIARWEQAEAGERAQIERAIFAAVDHTRATLHPFEREEENH